MYAIEKGGRGSVSVASQSKNILSILNHFEVSHMKRKVPQKQVLYFHVHAVTGMYLQYSVHVNQINFLPHCKKTYIM